LRAVRNAGIDVLVSLTVDALSERPLQRHNILGWHFPIVGMGVPRLEQVLSLMDALSRELHQGKKIAFHCTAGVGRTGTMLACHLVWRGKSAPSAITRVREVIPRAIQTSGQEAFVRQFADALRSRPQGW
jgi:atypical dual specificity phosphatase